MVTITSQQPDNVDQSPVVVTQVSTVPFTPSSTSARASSTALPGTSSNAQNSDSSGLSTGATIGIAVAVPVVVLALLAGLGFLFWRRRKRNKDAMVQRKAEADAYSFDPNAGGAVAGASAMTQGEGGYRGWGSTQGAAGTNGAHTGSLTSSSNFQAGRGEFGPAAAGVGAGVAAGAVGAAALGGRRASNRIKLEEPTVPAFAQDDLDSVAPSSPRLSSMQSGPGYPLDNSGPEPMMPRHSGSPSETLPLMSAGTAAAPVGAATAAMPPAPLRHQYANDYYGGASGTAYNANPAALAPGRAAGRAPYPITETPAPAPAQSGTGRMSAFLPPLQNANNQRTPAIVHNNAEQERRYSYAENF